MTARCASGAFWFYLAADASAAGAEAASCGGLSNCTLFVELMRSRSRIPPTMNQAEIPAKMTKPTKVFKPCPLSVLRINIDVFGFF